MLIWFYSFLPLLFLPTDSSSIRDRNFNSNNDLQQSTGAVNPIKKDNNDGLKVVSNDPFIIQLEMPNPEENAVRNGGDKDKKSKRPAKKRVTKIKSLRKRLRRDLQSAKAELKRERKSNHREVSQKESQHETKNSTKNVVSKLEMLKALSPYPQKKHAKKNKKHIWDFDENEKIGTKSSKYDSDRQPSNGFVKMVYPSTPKPNKHSHKYTYKDLMADRERLEKKIKYIRNILSSSDDLIRVRRRSESDKTANKIAQVFLTLSAVNGLHDKMKSNDDEVQEEEEYHTWERQENPRKTSSVNEERYKVKKWIEHMKSKRMSSKTCPCVGKEREEDGDAFPLEQKLPKDYYLFQRSASSEESSEGSKNPLHSCRESVSRRRVYKTRDDQSKLRPLGRANRKFEVPLDDLEVYRTKAKQILQNAEEILDKIKEEEEKRLAAPTLLLSHLKELTARIQSDPRNKENDLIRKIQKNIGRGLGEKSADGGEGNSFLDNMKSLILNPYEKAKALTDDNAKKISSYLLRNLGELQESSESKEEKPELKMFFDEVQHREEPSSASLAKEKEKDIEKDAVSSKPDAETMLEETQKLQEEQFKKRMQEMMKEQEKKLNEYEVPPESGENSNELSESVSKAKEETEYVKAADDSVAGAPSDNIKIEPTEEHKPAETIQTEVVSDKKPEILEKTKNIKDGEESKEVLEEIMKEIAENENVQLTQEGDNKAKSSDDEKGEAEVVAATAEKESESPNYESEPIGEIGFMTEMGHEMPNVEMESPHSEDSATDETKKESGDTESVSLSDPEVDERVGAPVELVVESQKEIQSDDLIQEPKPEEPLGTINTEEKTSNTGDNLRLEAPNEGNTVGESKTEPNPEEPLGAINTEASDIGDNLRLEAPNGDKAVEGSKTEEENIPGEDHESAVLTEDKILGGGTENSKEDSDENEKEVLGLEKDLSKETPSVEEHKEKNSKESSEEISLGKPTIDERGGEALEGVENPMSDAGGVLESTNREEETPQHEDTTPLKATANIQKEETDGDPNDETNGVVAAPLEEKGEEGSNETLLESAVGATEEESDRVESSQKAGDENEVDENGELQSAHEIDEEPLKSEKAALDNIEEELDSLKEKFNSEVVAEEEKEENLDKDEMRVKAADPAEESVQESEHLHDDDITEKENPNVEGRKDSMGRIEDEVAKVLEEGDVKSSGETPMKTEAQAMKQNESGEDTLKAAHENTHSENLVEADPQLKAAKPEEDLQMAVESTKNGETNDRDDEVEAVRSDADDVGDEKPETLKAANNEEMMEENLKEDTEDEISLKSALTEEENEAKAEVENEETPLKAANIQTSNENAKQDDVTLKGLSQEEGLGEDETPLQVTNTGETKEDENNEQMGGIPVLRATVQKNDEETPETVEAMRATDIEEVGEAIQSREDEAKDEISLRAEHSETPSGGEDGETPLRAEHDVDEEAEQPNTEEATLGVANVENIPEDLTDRERPSDETNLREENRKSSQEALVPDDNVEAPLGSASLEEFDNDIDGNDTPLLSEMDYAEPKEVGMESSEDSLRASNLAYDLSNQVDGEDDESPLQSANPFGDTLEIGDDTLKEENLRSKELEDPTISGEDEYRLAAADPLHPPERSDLQSDNLLKEEPHRKSPKARKLKVPTSIAKIMKDLNGKEKEDISSIENLNPEKIDHIIDKIDEAEQQNMVMDEVDCRKECACAEEMDTRSRNIGRYEIVKDFLHWMKDLQMNRVLSDD